MAAVAPKTTCNHQPWPDHNGDKTKWSFPLQKRAYTPQTVLVNVIKRFHRTTFLTPAQLHARDEVVRLYRENRLVAEPSLALMTDLLRHLDTFFLSGALVVGGTQLEVGENDAWKPPVETALAYVDRQGKTIHLTYRCPGGWGKNWVSKYGPLLGMIWILIHEMGHAVFLMYGCQSSNRCKPDHHVEWQCLVCLMYLTVSKWDPLFRGWDYHLPDGRWSIWAMAERADRKQLLQGNNKDMKMMSQKTGENTCEEMSPKTYRGVRGWARSIFGRTPEFVYIARGWKYLGERDVIVKASVFREARKEVDRWFGDKKSQKRQEA